MKPGETVFLAKSSIGSCALEDLSPRRRQAITLLLAGRSTKEAAGMLGISAQCVRRSKASAVRQLHEALCPAG